MTTPSPGSPGRWALPLLLALATPATGQEADPFAASAALARDAEAHEGAGEWEAATAGFEAALAAAGRAAVEHPSPRRFLSLLLGEVRLGRRTLREIAWETLPGLRLRSRATQEILVAAERLARHGAHPGERVEMAAEIAAAWVDGGRPEEARRVLAAFAGDVERVPSAATRNRARYDLGRGWARAGAAGEALAVAAGLPRPGGLLAELGGSLADAGDEAGARALLSRIDDPSARAKVQGRIARAAAAAGDLRRALALSEGIEDPQWRTSVIQDVAIRQAEAGACAEGRATADRLQGLPAVPAETLDLSGGAARISPWDRVLSLVAGACARGGDPTGAIDVAAGIQDTRRQVEALAAVAQAHPDPTRARELLVEAHGRAGTIIKPGIRGLALVPVAQAWRQRGECGPGREVLEAAWGAAGQVEKAGLGDARFTLLDELARCGGCAEAASRARSFRDPFWRDGALTRAAQGCAQAGDAPAGLALAKEIRTPLWATNAFQ
ncbi:MAG: hypothetical protein FJ098_13255, partial [Deltaproteobacteria bacterium]|nr:hypothetical protein [Deltaproteobacteria bacterium]